MPASWGRSRASASRDREPRPLAKQLGATAAGVTLDVLEQQCWALFFQCAAGDGSDLAVPIHFGRDPPQLTMLIKLRHPLAHIPKAHRMLTPSSQMQDVRRKGLNRTGSILRMRS